MSLIGYRSAAETSCGAADRVKPKARLCEPWVNPPQVIKPRRGDRDRAWSARPVLPTLCRRFAALSVQLAITQGSQSFALGLTLVAAPQLLECSRLVSWLPFSRHDKW